MEELEFSRLKEEFVRVSTEAKIHLYTRSKGLTMLQYKELLRLFPYEELKKLEEAMV